MGFDPEEINRAFLRRNGIDPDAVGKSQSAGAAQKAGGRFESDICAENAALEAARRAIVFKVPTPVRIHKVNKRTGRLTASKAPAVWVDYSGTVYLDGFGQSVHFEAKSSTIQTRIPFAQIADHQLEKLRRATEFGAWCFLLARRCDEQTKRPLADYVLPVASDGRIANHAHKRALDGAAEHARGVRESVAVPTAEKLGLVVGVDETWLDAVMRLRSAQPRLWI